MNYIPNTDYDLQQMLESFGVSDFEDLLKNVPASLRYRHSLNIPQALPEHELIKHLTGLSKQNKMYDSCFAGGGAYDHYIPAVIGNLIARSEFMTAYTPYQAEVAQGTLQSIYEFQSMISSLNGLPVTNASMYDGASALAEAALLASRHTRRTEILVAATVNPNYIETIKTYISGTDLNVAVVPSVNGLLDYKQLRNSISDKTAALIIQSPNFMGLIENIDDITGDVQSCGGLLVQCYDPISLGILKTPGEYGADIACAVPITLP